MNIDIDLLLLDSIMKNDNPDIWKGNYVVGNLNQKISGLAIGCREMLTKSSLDSILMRYKDINVSNKKCWVASGAIADVVDVEFKNMVCRFIFEKDEVHLQVELKFYCVMREEFDITNVAVDTLIEGLKELDNLLNSIDQNWNEKVGNIKKRARMEQMQYVAIESYLKQRLAETGYNLSYRLRQTPVSTIVEIVAEGEREVSTSVRFGEQVNEKLELAISEMCEWLKRNLSI